MPRILLIQSRSDPAWVERELKNFRRVVGRDAELHTLSALDEKLAWSTPDEFLEGYDGVILGGSSDIDFDGGRAEKDPARLLSLIVLSRVRNIVSYALAEGVPMLGICFGHQLIARMHGAPVEHDAAQGKTGPHDIVLTEAGRADPLFAAAPACFAAQYRHKDSIVELPDGATLLANGAHCRYSVLRYGEKTYTMQFHPESDRPVPHAEGPFEAARIVSLWIGRIVLGGREAKESLAVPQTMPTQG